MIEWKRGRFNTEKGSVGDIHLFTISWRMNRSDPDWVMESSLPGHTGERWKNDSKAHLKSQAEVTRQQFATLLGGEE